MTLYLFPGRNDHPASGRLRLRFSHDGPDRGQRVNGLARPRTSPGFARLQRLRRNQTLRCLDPRYSAVHLCAENRGTTARSSREGCCRMIRRPAPELGRRSPKRRRRIVQSPHADIAWGLWPNSGALIRVGIETDPEMKLILVHRVLVGIGTPKSCSDSTSSRLVTRRDAFDPCWHRKMQKFLVPGSSLFRNGFGTALRRSFPGVPARSADVKRFPPFSWPPLPMFRMQ